METFADRLARMEVISATESPLPRELGEWACACLRDLQELRRRRDGLPQAIAKALRDQRIVRAASVLPSRDPWPTARLLHAEATKILDARIRLPLGSEPVASTLRGELQSAHVWYPLPESERTFERLLTKDLLVCQ